MQEELRIASTLVKCLSLNEDLSYQLKSFLMGSQKSDEYFSIREEKRIWDKLRPDLKHRKFGSDIGILQQTNIRVMKKCLFFLTHFSRNLQDTIAVKLVKRVFQPNERLGVDADAQSFFIIDQGKADLQFCRKHFKKQIFKTIRTINTDCGQDKLNVSSNLFGLTAVLLRRRVNLSALSKEFLLTYEFQEKDFHEFVSQSPVDF